MSSELLLLLSILIIGVLAGLAFYFVVRKFGTGTQDESPNEDLHWKIASYGELREELLKTTPQEYTREEIALTPENMVLLIESFEGEVNNGGIDQFFFNSSGDYYRETVEALEIIGAKNMLLILRKACARFPGGDPPVNLYKRREIMLRSVSPQAEGFTDLDEQFYKYEEDLYDLLERYPSH